MAPWPQLSSGGSWSAVWFASVLALLAAASQHETEFERNVENRDCRDVEGACTADAWRGPVYSRCWVQRSDPPPRRHTRAKKVLLEIRGALSGALADWQRPAARGVCLGKIGEDIERGGTCLSCPGHAAVYGCIQHHRWQSHYSYWSDV